METKTDSEEATAQGITTTAQRDSERIVYNDATTTTQVDAAMMDEVARVARVRAEEDCRKIMESS